MTSLAIGLVLALAVSSCIEPPEYPDTPSIEFKDIKSVRLVNRDGTFDVITVTVFFKDGNGDLGLDSLDLYDPKFMKNLPNGDPNPYHYNYSYKPYVKDRNGIFQRLADEFGVIEIPARFGRLAPSDKDAPLKGDLRFEQSFPLGLPFRKGDEVRFEISLTDRGLHESNTITTPSIIIP